MDLRTAGPDELDDVRRFYWDLIDRMKDARDSVGWKKGVYPDDALLSGSLNRGEMYVLGRRGDYAAAVILNSDCNEGYRGAPWSVVCSPEEVLVPHALGVRPDLQGRGVGKAVVADVIRLAEQTGRKAVRLDVLGTNRIAERLYAGMGFRFVQTRRMFYEDTGLTEFKLFELALPSRGLREEAPRT